MAPCWRSACALLRPLQGIACWTRLPSADHAGVSPEVPVCMGTAEYCSGHYLPLYRDTARPHASSDPAAGTRPVTASCSHRLTPALATLALQGHVQAEAQLAVPKKWLLQELQQALPQPQAKPAPQTAPLTAQRQTVEGQPCLVVSGDLGHRGQHHKGPSGSQALLVCTALEAQAWLSELLLQCFGMWCLVQGARISSTVPACWCNRLPCAATLKDSLHKLGSATLTPERPCPDAAMCHLPRALSTDTVLWLHSSGQGNIPRHAKCWLQITCYAVQVKLGCQLWCWVALLVQPCRCQCPCLCCPTFRWGQNAGGVRCRWVHQHI